MTGLMIGSALLVPFLKESGQALHKMYLLFSVLLSLFAAGYACLFERNTSEGVMFWLIPLAYVISVAFLMVFDAPMTFPFWTFGGLLILCAFRLRYGMFLNIYLLFVLGSMQTEPFTEVLLIQFICLLLLGLVMPYAKTWKDGINVLISVAAALVSIRIICYFSMEKTAIVEDIFSVAVVYALVIPAVLLLSKVLRENVMLSETNDNFDFLEELAAGVEEMEEEGYHFMTEEFLQDSMTDFTESEPVVAEMAAFEEDITEQLEQLCLPEAPLLKELSQRFPKAFLHARRVAFFASEVAEYMDGVDELLVKCAGFYHEIGKLRGDKTLEGTLSVAKEQQFPNRLIQVLREHTINGDKPTSKEAALVMLTDNICGMCEHLRKTQTGRILVAKVIDRAINLRVTKGDLNQSGLTVKDISVMQNTMEEVIKEDMF